MDTDRSGRDTSDGDSEVEVDGSDPTDPGSADADLAGQAEADLAGQADADLAEQADADLADLADPEPETPERTTIEDRLARLFRSGRINAMVAWAMVTVLVGVFIESLVDFDLLPMALVAAMTAVVIAPAVAARNPRVMPPWEVLVFALLPVLVRALLGGELGTFATYLAIAAFALIITVELQMFTTLRVTHWFAVVFVVLTTMATAAAWTVLRWNADRMLGTTYLTTNEALMVEWIYVTLAGLAAGVLFDAYFRRRGARLGRAIGWVVGR